MRARCWRTGWAVGGAVGTTLVGLAGPLGAQPAVTDARAVARAGIWATQTLESSPGAIRPPGWRLRLSLLDLYLGTGIVAGSAGAEAVGEHAGFAAALVGLWSPVGETHALRAAAQLGAGGVRAGLGLEVRRVVLERYARAWEFVPRAGCGWRAADRLTVVAAAEHAIVPQGAPRAALAIEIRLAPQIDIALQADRQPGIPVTLRVGLACGAAPLWIAAGFESTAQTCSLGFSWTWEHQEISWGGSTHPALGWSHAWTYAVSH